MPRYFDNRVHQHFTKLYSKVPYLDTEIFNIQTDVLRDSRRINKRTSRANQGITRTLEKSVNLENSLQRSRVQRQKQDSQFITKLNESKTQSINKGNESWREYLNKRQERKLRETNEQKFLGEKLLESNKKASDRIQSVRRWL